MSLCRAYNNTMGYYLIFILYAMGAYNFCPHSVHIYLVLVGKFELIIIG